MNKSLSLTDLEAKMQINSVKGPCFLSAVDNKSIRREEGLAGVQS